MYAQVPNDLKCHDARQGPIQAENVCLRWSGFPFNGGFALDFQDSCCTLHALLGGGLCKALFFAGNILTVPSLLKRECVDNLIK